jgi:hypothetical protein
MQVEMPNHPHWMVLADLTGYYRLSREHHQSARTFYQLSSAMSSRGKRFKLVSYPLLLVG